MSGSSRRDGLPVLVELRDTELAGRLDVEVPHVEAGECDNDAKGSGISEAENGPITNTRVSR